MPPRFEVDGPGGPLQRESAGPEENAPSTQAGVGIGGLKNPKIECPWVQGSLGMAKESRKKLLPDEDEWIKS